MSEIKAQLPAEEEDLLKKVADELICVPCNRRFAHHSSLSRHKRKHKKSSIFPCDDCEKSFSRKDALMRHRRQKKCDNVGRFPCGKCRKKFTVKSSLTRHMKVHQDTEKAEKEIEFPFIRERRSLDIQPEFTDSNDESDSECDSDSTNETVDESPHKSAPDLPALTGLGGKSLSL